MTIDPSMEFESNYYLEVNKARDVVFNSVLPDIIREMDLRSAIDVGCGIGYYTSFLLSLGLQVTGSDIREENIKLASARYPDANFFVSNVEQAANVSTQVWDLVFCAGLLYHLENPFMAIRYLYSLCNSVCVIESRVHWSELPILELGRERDGVSQAIDQYVLLLSRSSMIEMLYAAGFKYVYSIVFKSTHEELKDGLFKKPRRHFFVASLTPVSNRLLKLEKQASEGNLSSLSIYKKSKRRFLRSILESFKWLI